MKRRVTVAAFLLVALRHNHLSTDARRDEETSKRRSASVLIEEDRERPWQGHAVNGTATKDPLFVDTALEGKTYEAGASPAATKSKRRASESSTFYLNGDDEAQHSGSGSTRVSNRACPYVIHSEKEALARANNTSIPGNIVKVEHLRFCRTGNHFSTVFRNLALGYCCKSKLVWLPPKDDILAPGIFNEGNPGPQWFDFSSAPDVEGFESVSCRAHITWAGPRAFHMDQLDASDHSHYNPTLRECVKKVPRLLGCEAAYYFPMDIDVCLDGELKAAGEVGGGGGLSAEHDGKRRISDDVRLQGDVDDRREEGEDGGGGDNDADGEEENGGKLVLHVRSGDIFKDEVLWYYGQPPLQFYMYIIGNRKWDRIDVITNAENSTSLNPVVPALQAKKDSGELPENFHIHTNRSMAEDLRSMMCTDALGIARSTLVALTSFHSTATRIYGPVECNEQLTQLAKVRPEAKVYGLSWPRQYSVYQKWENTPDQREEMLKYTNITGLLQCTG